MMDYQEGEWKREDWERDMNFTIHGDVRFHRKAEKSLSPDRYRHSYHHTYLDDDTDDDTNSSMTSASTVSTVSSRNVSSIMGISLAGLDNFMYNQPPPSLQRSPAINFDFSEYPGIVQQIVPTRRPKQDQVNDWIDDIDVSDIASIAVSSVSTNLYNELIEDEEPLIDTAPPAGVVSPVIQSQNIRTRSHIAYEIELEEDDMTGLLFPDDLAHLPTLIEQRKASMLQPTRVHGPTKTVSPLLSNIERERDDDDFADGIMFETKAFVSKHTHSFLTPSTKPNKLQTKTAVKNKLPTNFVSRLARPTPVNNTNKLLEHVPSVAHRANALQPRIPVPSRQIPLSSVTNLREVNAPLTLNRSRFRPVNTVLAERKSPSGFTLIARPKTKTPPKYCTRLDDMDNLNVFPSKAANNKNTTFRQPSIQRASTRNVQPSSGQSRLAGQNVATIPSRPRIIGTSRGLIGESVSTGLTASRVPSTSSSLREPRGIVNSRPSILTKLDQHTSKIRNACLSSRPGVIGQFRPASRSNVQNRDSKPWENQSRNVQLIQPTAELLTNEYNNMRFDASTHTWRGNEGNANAVLERPTPRRQPMIISGGKGYAPSRYAAVVGNSMIFNSESRSWVASHGPEHNELDAFEDLLPRRVSTSGRPEHNAPEFQLPSIQEAIAQQDEHVRFMENWLGLIKGFQ